MPEPDHRPEPVPDHLPEQAPDHRPEPVPDRLPEQAPDRLPEQALEQAATKRAKTASIASKPRIRLSFLIYLPSIACGYLRGFVPVVTPE